MRSAIRPLRRLTVTLAMTAVAGFGAVTVAPAAFADTVAPQPTPPTVAATDPTTPAVVYDKNGNPVAAPKICTPQDLADTAQRVADATAKVARLVQLAAKSHDAAAELRAQEPTMTAYQVRMAELVAGRLDSVGDKFAGHAQAVIDKAGEMDCLVLPTGARF